MAMEEIRRNPQQFGLLHKAEHGAALIFRATPYPT